MPPVCYNCGGEHLARDCTSKGRGKGWAPGKGSGWSDGKASGWHEGSFIGHAW